MELTTFFWNDVKIKFNCTKRIFDISLITSYMAHCYLC
jgi:hypothetical protein